MEKKKKLPHCFNLLLCVLSCVQLSETPWTVAHQAPLAREFPRQEHWSELPFPPPEHPRDQTRGSSVSCTGRRVLYHCTTWEAHCNLLHDKKPVHPLGDPQKPSLVNQDLDLFVLLRPNRTLWGSWAQKPSIQLLIRERRGRRDKQGPAKKP